MLNDVWRDLLSLAGFLVTLGGFAFAFYQISKTKSAARAAEDAAKQSLKRFKDYQTANARLFLAETKIFVEKEDWVRASVRINDLARILPHAEGTLLDVLEQMRIWIETFEKLASQRIRRFAKAKWQRFVVRAEWAVELSLAQNIEADIFRREQR